MKVQHLVILAAAVAALGGAAYYFSQENKALQSDAFVSGPLSPGLDVAINRADSLRIESQEGGLLELKRAGDDDAWTISTNYGYRASQERVSGLLKRLATLETVEPKTAKPENHAKLNLDDPAGENALGTRITVKGGDEVLTDMVVGLSRVVAEGGSVFVRRWEENQTWLADGEFKPRRRLLDLLDRNIVNIDGRRIRMARITHRDASGAEESIVISKATPDQPDYALAAVVPDGMQQKASHELATVARVGEFLILEQVLPAGDVVLTNAVISVYETFDGLRLIFNSAKQADDKIWTTVTATAAPRSDGLDLFMTEFKGQDSESGRIADQLKTPDEIAAEIAAIKSHAEGWAYRPTDYKGGLITATADKVLEEIKEEGAGAAKQ